MRRIAAIIVGVIFFHSLCWAEEQAPLNGQTAKDSYSLGYDFGANLKRQAVAVDLTVLLSAVRDGLENRQPAVGPEEIKKNLVELRRKLMVLQDLRSREYAARNLEAGTAFLETNKLKEGVKTLSSGLQYKVLKEGTGPVPKPSDSVTVHYRGTLIDGKEFDSSYGRGEPATLPLGSMIQGWQEVLPLMKTGSQWQLFVPPDLAYGQRQSARIPPNSTLVFEIELLAIGVTSGADRTDLSLLNPD